MRSGGATSRTRRGPGELESEVLAALWAAEDGLTPAQVQDALVVPTAYNTVQTILSRLLDKGLVRRQVAGRGHAYRPAQGQAELAAAQMHALMTRGSDHLAVLQRFVDALDPEDETALRRLISSTGTTGDPASRS